MNEYAKYFDSNDKYINLLVQDEKPLQKYNEIWDKINNLLKEEFDWEAVYKDKYKDKYINK